MSARHRTSFVGRTVLAAVAIAVMAAGVTARQRLTEAEMVAAARALDRAFVDAFNRGDAEALAALYWRSPDTVSMPPNELVVRGFDAIKGRTTNMLASSPGRRYEILESHYIPAGDIVVTWALARFTIPQPNGTTREVTERFTDVKAMREGKWVIIYEHASFPIGSAAARPAAQ